MVALQSSRDPVKRSRNSLAARKGYLTILRLHEAAKSICPGFDVETEGLEQLRIRLSELRQPSCDAQLPAPDPVSLLRLSSLARRVESKILYASTFSTLARSNLNARDFARTRLAVRTARLSITSARTLLAQSPKLAPAWIKHARQQLAKIQKIVSGIEHDSGSR
jgi:hypothetical protein